MTDQRLTYVLKWLMVVVLVLYVGQFVVEILTRVRTVAYVLIASVFLAYLIFPAVQRLRKHLGLVSAIVVVYAVILGTLIVGALFVVPHILENIDMLVKQYPAAVARLHALVFDPRNPITSHLPLWLQQEIARMPDQAATWITGRGLAVFGRVVTVLEGTVAIVAIFVIVPMVTAYLLLDLHHLRQSLAALVPEERWRTAQAILADIDGVIGGFIRGQLLVALTVGILITLALMLLHVPYPFLFGLLAAIGDLIPYVGAVIAYLPAVLSAGMSNGWINALLVTVAFVFIYEVEGHFIAPNVVGKQVRLSAFVVMLSLLVGADVAGLFGMLIAVPVAGVIRVLANRMLRAAKSS
jgi:predicted PurR-regulated permease PerM